MSRFQLRLAYPVPDAVYTPCQIQYLSQKSHCLDNNMKLFTPG